MYILNLVYVSQAGAWFTQVVEDWGGGYGTALDQRHGPSRYTRFSDEEECPAEDRCSGLYESDILRRRVKHKPSSHVQ
eukprot:646875-Amorphochlora_amoeboformis.AAC.3